MCPTCGCQNIDFLPNGTYRCRQCNTVFQPGQSRTTYINIPPQPVYSSKDRVAAGLFAIFLGGLGVHKFYLGRVGTGLIYLLFCWTGIPSIIGFVEGILYLCKSEYEFRERYCRLR